MFKIALIVIFAGVVALIQVTAATEDIAAVSESIAPIDLRFNLNRTLTAKYFLSTKIFDMYYSIPDILLLTGITVGEIKHFSNTDEIVKYISTSTSQIGNGWINTPLIILDEPSHFQKICNMTTKPVHWFHFENSRKGIMRRVRSRGKISSDFDNFILNVHYNVSENALFELGELEDTNPVCIHGERPTDNSRFLAHLGRRLKLIYPERHVALIRIHALVQKIKATNYTESEEATEIVLRNELGLRKDKRAELLLDDFNYQELESKENFNIVKDIFEIITTQLKPTRIWTTTASDIHHVEWLEFTLDVNCYKLEPLQEEVQLKFFVDYWTRNQSQKLDHDKLYNFGKESLRNLTYERSPISKEEVIFDKDILTRLLAELNEERAIQYARVDHDENEIDLSILSIFPLPNKELEPIGITQLYENWISMKFENYLNSEWSDDENSNSSRLNVDELFKMHVRLSLEFIFPGQFQRLKEDFGVVNMEEVGKVGILRKPKGNFGGAPIPVYDRLTDYFVAAFLHDSLKGKGDGHQIKEELADFIMKGGLATKNKNIDHTGPHHNKGFTSFEFIYPGILYFLEHFLKVAPVTSNVEIINPAQTTEKLRQVAHACANSDSYHIFKYFDEQLGAFGESNNKTSSIFDGEMLLVTIAHARLEFVKTVLTRFRQYHPDHEVDDMMHRDILDTGMKRGDFWILEYLLEDKQLNQGVAELRGWAKSILIDCVHMSKDDPEMVIDDKIKMVELLIGVNRALLEERDEEGNTPVHVKGIHVRLQIELIRLGADVLGVAQDEERRNGSIVHVDWSSHLTPREYHSLVIIIPKEKLGKLVRIKNGREEAPLASLLRYMEPRPETFDLFKEVGAQFEFEDVYNRNRNCDLEERDCSILGLAIYKGRSVATIKKLIEHGADFNLKGRDGQALLHLAAALGRLSVAEYLTRGNLIDVNAKDGDGLTALDSAIKSRYVSGPGSHFDMDEYGNSYKTGLFLHGLGGNFTGGLSELHLAAQNKFPPAVKLLLHLGVDVNGVDYESRHGNTPLHTGVEAGWWSGTQMDYFPVAKLLLDNGANPNISNNEGEIPFQVAVKNDLLDFETFRLLQSKSDVRWTPTLGNLALVTLVKKGDVEAFPSLAHELEGNGGDLNYRDEEGGKGRSLLHFAVKYGNDRAVHFLIENGADVNLTNVVGERTPILEVTPRNSVDIIKFLIDNGADVYSRNYIKQ